MVGVLPGMSVLVEGVSDMVVFVFVSVVEEVVGFVGSEGVDVGSEKVSYFERTSELASEEHVSDSPSFPLS